MKFDEIANQIILESKLKPKISKERIAKKYKISIKEAEHLLKVGAKVEKEHTKDRSTAETIASHHIFEVKDYYQKLKKAKL
jgi:hypothetical protein